MKAWVVGALMLAGGEAAAQGFSCDVGMQSACLSEGETVCSTFGRCVDKNAACFDRYQCDFEGFTCTSNVTECQANLSTLAEAHSELQERHEALTAEYEALAEASEALIEQYDALIECVRETPISMDVIDCTY
ncbi:excinuclease ABC subunit B [Oceanicola granulosus HTCC2516]|uniref:Excinuclease ABC subunit B n=1 Tax=Oceanicola granulosus (strain ATCC BAA-861 / DSM 15982 / KCTC 12143 / HTCC2516) TaxID=314256 RepID=Q2CEX8_OCEGH|nr:hypothetical protein [Oceanicola granulosus]EAR51232.1 excinuclease ABC subunit B [Oceanicola granulosus HTCC2516]